MQNGFHAVFGEFHAGFIEKEGEIWYFQGGRIPPVSKKVSINDSLGSVTINGEPRSSLWVKEGETVAVATTLKDGYWMEFMKWTAQDGSATPVEPSDNWQTSTAFTFKMPAGDVSLTAQWSASSLDPYQPIDPDEPLDEDFGVEPAPMDTTGGTIAAVAVF